MREIEIPNDVLDPTLEFLAERGTHGCEGFVVWGARMIDSGNDSSDEAAGSPSPTPPVLRFTSCYVPEQTAHRTESGLLVVVEGDALFRMNRALYQRGEIAAGQVHTHPTDAYHSDTDDHFPLVTKCGAISLVLPDFATGGRAAVDRWAWYRLVGQGLWAPLSSETTIYFESET